MGEGAAGVEMGYGRGGGAVLKESVIIHTRREGNMDGEAWREGKGGTTGRAGEGWRGKERRGVKSIEVEMKDVPIPAT